MTVSDERALRRGLLAVTVLHDLDLAPDDQGVALRCPGRLRIEWAEWADALDGADPGTVVGVERLARYARARRMLGIAPRVQPLPFAVPAGHPLHPGASWVRRIVPGGILDLGLGIAGLDPTRPDRILPLPARAAERHGVDTAREFAAAQDYASEMAALAVARLTRRPDDALRPMGRCDVVTLLAASTFRTGLVAARAGTIRGMRTAAVPRRDRGWLDLRRIDPEFVSCAAAATAPEERGFPRPLLVTADELTLAGPRARYLPRSAEETRATPVDPRS